MHPTLAALDQSRLPRHLAIIMDGNGRWAQARGRCRIIGHHEGAESVRIIVHACLNLGIKALTLYAFSEENWGRPNSEVKALMILLNHFLQSQRKQMLDNGICFKTIGEINRLPNFARRQIEQVINDTSLGKNMVLTLALSYGGRQEIIRAVRLLATEVAAGRINPRQIDEKIFVSQLFTSGLPDPDLLVRTSGEFRVSNFLLWQIAYSELYFTSVCWPDFREEVLAKALTSFAIRQRRFGKIDK